MVSKPLSFNEQLDPSASAFQKKKNSIQKAPQHKSHFSKKLIAQISRPSRDRANGGNQSPFRASTRLHAPEKVSNLRSRATNTDETTMSQIFRLQSPNQESSTLDRYIDHRSIEIWKNRPDPTVDAPPRSTQISGSKIHAPHASARSDFHESRYEPSQVELRYLSYSFVNKLKGFIKITS